MTKKMVEDNRSISYNTIAEVIETIDALIKEYPHLTYKDITVGIGYGDTTYSQIEFSRPENETEEKQRLEYEKAAEHWKRIQYEALKKEFEK